MSSVKLVFFALTLIYMAPTYAIDSEPVQKAVTTMLLTDDDVNKAAFGARNTLKSYPTDVMMTDLVAERLLKTSTQGQDAKHIASMVWQIRALALLENPRYRSTLEAVRQQIAVDSLKEHVDGALKRIRTKDDAQYVPGSANLAESRAQAQNLLEANKKSDRTALASFKQYATLATMMDSLGAPDDMTVWDMRTETLVLHYFGAGILFVRLDPNPSARFYLHHASPERVPVMATYNGPNKADAQILGSERGRPLVEYYKANRRRISSDMDAMYILIRRIMEIDADAYHRYDEAMYEIALKTLWKSPDPRGKEWVRMVATKHKRDDVQEFAAKVSTGTVNTNDINSDAPDGSAD